MILRPQVQSSECTGGRVKEKFVTKFLDLAPVLIAAALLNFCQPVAAGVPVSFLSIIKSAVFARPFKFLVASRVMLSYRNVF